MHGYLKSHGGVDRLRSAREESIIRATRGIEPTMLKLAFHTLMYWVPTLLICLLIAARVLAPFPYDGADSTPPVEESLNSVTRQMAYQNDLYVQVDGRDPSAEVLADLNNRQLPAKFEPWSARSPALDHCRASTFNATPVGTCMRDNFLSADLLSMPLWHVALVRVQTAGCAAELTLVRGAAQWHVLSQRSLCT